MADEMMTRIGVFLVLYVAYSILGFAYLRLFTSSPSQCEQILENKHERCACETTVLVMSCPFGDLA